MLLINFTGVKPEKSSYDFAVQGNSNANVIRFLLAINQDDVDLSSLVPYLKVKSIGNDYLDKIDLTEHTTIDNITHKVQIEWTMDALATANKYLKIQLMFEDYPNHTVWQTEIVKLRLIGSIDIDSDMCHRYPQILSYLLAQVGTIPSLESGNGIIVTKENNEYTLRIDESIVVTATYLAGIIANYVTLNGSQDITGIKRFLALPVTNAGREYTSDRQLVDKQFVIDYLAPHLQDYLLLSGKVSAIELLIPSQASAGNQLADKNFVNSSINNLASFPISSDAQGDNFPTKKALDEAYVSGEMYYAGQKRVPTKNDYCLVEKDETHWELNDEYTDYDSVDDYVGFFVLFNSQRTLVTEENKNGLGIVAGTTPCYSAPTTRYVFTGVYGVDGQWAFQWVVNNSPFTQAQKDAINSGITKALVEQIKTNSQRITVIEGKMQFVDIVILTTDWTNDLTASIPTGADLSGDSTHVNILSSNFASDTLIRTYNVKGVSYDDETGYINFEATQLPVDDIYIRVEITRGN